MAEPWHLTDSNILLRLSPEAHSDYPVIRAMIDEMQERRVPIGYTLQNLTEFWNVVTRPVHSNGFDLSIREANRLAGRFEKAFTLLPDTESVCAAWRQIVLEHEVRGRQVHDARLVASMRTYGIQHIITLNGADFRRYPDIVVVSPRRGE